MNKVTAGSFIAGGLVGAAGLMWLLSDDGTKRRMAKEGRRMMKRAEHMIDI